VELQAALLKIAGDVPAFKDNTPENDISPSPVKLAFQLRELKRRFEMLARIVQRMV